jgi:hypothetical protein
MKIIITLESLDGISEPDAVTRLGELAQLFPDMAIGWKIEYPPRELESSELGQESPHHPKIHI